MKHMMPINDIDHAWTQDVTVRITHAPDGGRLNHPYLRKETHYFGRCTCGEVFEGKDSSEVTRQYVAHSDREEGR